MTFPFMDFVSVFKIASGSLLRRFLDFFMRPKTPRISVRPVVGTGVFPHLRELALINSLIEDRDLDHMPASSPVLEKLALIINFGKAKHLCRRGQKLQCVLFWESMAVELAAVGAPCLERLIMWDACAPSEGDGSLMGVKIAKDAPKPKVLGYLEPRVHQLKIGNAIIKADTSFLRCFPNIETLHVESAIAEPAGKDYIEFFKEISPIECVHSHIKKVVLHDIYGDISEVMFIKYISQRANELQKLTLVFSDKGRATAGEMKYVVETLAIPPWASKTCTFSLVEPKLERGLNFHKVSDLSIGDPFLEHGHELFRFVKEGE